jgi:long-chain fatty acid transport protein
MSRRRLVYSFLSVVFVLILSTPVFGAGFGLYEGSARGNVLGAGLVASADDASALFYNPAGITQLKGIQTQLGFTAIMPMITVQTNVPTNATVQAYQAAGSYSTDFQSNWYFPPQAYMTYQINDSWWAGLGIFTRFGLGTEFKDPVNPGWPGRYNSYRATISEVEINPNVAWKINDKFSVAAGVVASYFNLSLSKAIPGVLIGAGSDLDMKLSGDSWGWGWDLALQYKPVEWMQFGLTYRSKIEQNVKGNVAVNRTFTPNPFVSIANMSAGGDLTLPDEIFAGINFNVTKTWSVGGGVYWTGWQYYDKLQINFGAPFGAPASTTNVSPKNWANVARYMIATEWKATPNWDLRLGYAYDVCPIPDNTLDYILPDNDRHMLSIGGGYHQNAWSVDLSYTYMIIIDRSYSGTNTATSPSGSYPGKLTNGTAHLIGLTLGYKF